MTTGGLLAGRLHPAALPALASTSGRQKPTLGKRAAFLATCSARTLRNPAIRFSISALTTEIVLSLL